MANTIDLEASQKIVSVQGLDHYHEKAMAEIDEKINSGGIGKAGTGKNAEIFNTDNLASGNCSHAEGDSTIAAGIAAHAEGYSTSANKDYSHSEGYMAVASGTSSHAEGHKTRAMGDYSHAEGNHCSAHGVASHAGGSESVATGDNAFTHGDAVKANNNNEIAFGAFNASNADTLFSVGNGTSDINRSNAFEITKTTGKLFDKEIATKEDIPSSLPANGGNAATAYAVDSMGHKARLYEDPEGGNLRLESPDGSLSMEMDMYDNKSLRMYFERNGEFVLPFLYSSIYNNVEIPKLNGARISSVGVKKGYVSSSIADVISYDERVVHKQSSDTSYIGWTTTSDGWFAPIFVSKTVEGTRYTMNENECMYSVGGEKCGSFTHNGETYYACWNNPASLMNPAVSTSALYVALNGEDYVSTCKKLIDICEGAYADGGAASVGAYTEEKIAALEARIAALEGGN